MSDRGDKLKIAIIAPPWLKLYPGCFYGIEIMVQNLASELTKLGHHVELFSIKGTKTKVTKLHYYHNHEQFEYVYRPYYEASSVIIPHIQYALNVIRQAGDFDIIHDHNSYIGPAILANATDLPPALHTLHEPFTDKRLLRQGIPDTRMMFDQFKHIDNLYFNAVSKSQLKYAPKSIERRLMGVVYNGVALSDHIYNAKKDNYYAFVGSLTKDKGIDTAARVCFELGLKLKIAGTIGGAIESPSQLRRELRKSARQEAEKEDPIFRFFKTQVVSYLKPRQIQYLGAVTGADKKHLFSQAKGFLNPIDRDEPFGLSVIDALASGTPVVTYRRGAMPEIIKHRVNGFIAENYQEFKFYVKKVDEIDPAACRESVVKRFSSEVMANNYVDLYRKIIRQS